MARVLILSGGGRYSDPWHPFPTTSQIIASALAEAGHEVEVSDRVEQRLCELTPGSIDVLLTDIGNAAADNVEVPTWDEPDPERYATAMQNLVAYRDSGGGLVGVHVSATAWPDEPEWANFLGGRWVRGTTMHPPLGPASIEVIDRDHPVTTGVASFETEDEKYTYLHVHDGVRVLAQHTYEGKPQPLVWAHETPAGGRVVYTALGHDEGAYEAPEVLRIIGQGVDWVTAARG